MPKNPKRVAAGKRAKRKGNSYEREIAKKLQAWWPGNYEFVRTPSSGGWATKEVREGFRTCGDIVTNAPDFFFTVECKNEKDASITQLLTAPRSSIYRFWDQAVEQSPENEQPMLVARCKSKDIVFLDNSYLHSHTKFHVYNKDIRFLLLQGAYTYQLIMMLFKDFLSTDPEHLRR